MQIRPYEPTDELAVVALWQECDLTRPWNDPRKDIARKLNVQPELFLVGAVNGQLVASVVAGYEGHRGWVNYLAVSHAHRGNGYGKKLMQRVEQFFLEAGCPKINLLVRALPTPASSGSIAAWGMPKTRQSAWGRGSFLMNQRSNPSIERTSSSVLRTLPAAAHVKR